MYVCVYVCVCVTCVRIMADWYLGTRVLFVRISVLRVCVCYVCASVCVCGACVHVCMCTSACVPILLQPLVAVDLLQANSAGVGWAKCMPDFSCGRLCASSRKCVLHSHK